MRKQTVLITGGAGFIGSHLSDELLSHGYHVRILDNLAEQVHGPAAQRPEYLNADAELVIGDVRNAAIVRKCLRGVDTVYHLAASVNVGQSMYRIYDYTSVNNLGTATLLEELAAQRPRRLVVASSMSVYGEGLYHNGNDITAIARERSLHQLRRGDWNVYASDGTLLTPMPTSEDKPPALASVYALSKYDQEQLCLMVGRAYGIETVALRFFNVYGPRQALSNPYTGVLAIFAARLLNNNAPLIFEDGQQTRDFVHVRDIAQACRLAMTTEAIAGEIFNIGSGLSYTVEMLSTSLATVMNRKHLQASICGKYRFGDIRHCFADISHARQRLGYKPQISLDRGMIELAQWLENQTPEDKLEAASAELNARGLTV